MAFPTKDRTPHLRLERDLIVLAAMIADYLKTLWRILTAPGFFCAAFCAPLRCHQIALVKDLLFLLREQKRFLALNADCFDVGHRNTSLIPSMIGMGRIYHICAFSLEPTVTKEFRHGNGWFHPEYSDCIHPRDTKRCAHRTPHLPTASPSVSSIDSRDPQAAVVQADR